jgi:phosphate transport system protein
MADFAVRMAEETRQVMVNPDAAVAAELETDDDVMDELYKGLFVVLLGLAWRHGVESAIDGALPGRFYERYADHTVNAGCRRPNG